MKSSQIKNTDRELEIQPGGYFLRDKRPIQLLKVGEQNRGFTFDTNNGMSHSDFFTSSVFGKTGVNQRKLILTDATANDIFTVDIPVLGFGGGRITWECVASDGVDVQCRTGITTFSGVNKAGALTTDVDEIGGSIAVSAGTLTGTWSVANGTNKITLRFTPTSSLTPTTLTLFYSYESISRVVKV